MTFAITKATVTVTPDTGQSKVYGDIDPTFTCTPTGLTTATPSASSPAPSTGPPARTSAPTHRPRHLDAGSNYTPSSRRPGDLRDHQGDRHVTPDAGQSKVYGDRDPIFTCTASRLSSGDTVRSSPAPSTGPPARTSAPTRSASAPRRRPNNTTCLDASPVTFAITQGHRHRHPRLPASQGLRRHRSDLHLTASCLANGDTVSVFTGALDRASGENVGTYPSASAPRAGANYTTVLDAAPVTFEITKRALTIAAHGVDRMYDGTDVATVTFTDNRLSGDTLSIAYGSALFDDRNAGTAKTINVTGISISGTDAGNYTFNTTASTSADITQRSITVTAQANTKVADGNTSAAATARRLRQSDRCR